jgi:DNA-binding response OmpR family regulator
MPRLDGLGVVDELRAQTRTATLPVIVLTAQSSESEEKALDLGAHHYLTKPVPTGSLVARVRAVLKRINTCSRNHLPGNRRPRGSGGAWAAKPLLA